MHPQCRRSPSCSWVGRICWRRDRLLTPVFLGFPCDSAGKESACNAGDLGSIPGLGILQARILEWVAFPFSRGIFPTEVSSPGLPHWRWILYQLSHKGRPYVWLYYFKLNYWRHWQSPSFEIPLYFSNQYLRRAQLEIKRVGRKNILRLSVVHYIFKRGMVTQLFWISC